MRAVIKRQRMWWALVIGGLVACTRTSAPTSADSPPPSEAGTDISEEASDVVSAEIASRPVDSRSSDEFEDLVQVEEITADIASRTDMCPLQACDEADAGPASMPDVDTCPSPTCEDADADSSSSPDSCPASCDDGDACTEDSCNASGSCKHQPAADCCLAALGAACPSEIGFICVSEGKRHTCENAATGEVWVPAGVFWMGCNESKEKAYCHWSEKPQHRVQVSAFAIDRMEVSAGDYGECTAAGVCTGPSYKAEYWAKNSTTAETQPTYPTMPTFPMNFVTPWFAHEYCEWDGKAAGAQRLCTEAEWEKAARGSCVVNGCDESDDACCKAAMRSFPWGDEPPTCEFAVMLPFWGPSATEKDLGCKTGFMWEPGQKPVGASPYGALDMAGNAAEWINSGMGTDCPYPKEQGLTLIDPQCGQGGGGIGLRGGSFINAIYTGGNADALRSGDRGYDYSDEATPGYGIRCCRSLPGGP